MNYLMMLALGLGLTNASYATEEKNLDEALAQMDETNGLRKRAELVEKFIDSENLLQKLFTRVVDSEQLKEEFSDAQRESFKKTLKTIDEKNAIHKRFKLVGKYMDKNNLVKKIVDEAYDEGGISKDQTNALVKLLSANTKEKMKEMAKLAAKTLDSTESKHNHEDLSSEKAAKKIDKSNAVRKIMTSVVTVVGKKDVLQKFFDGIMTDSRVSEKERKTFMKVLKSIDKHNLLKKECKRIATLIDNENSLRNFFHTTSDQAAKGTFSLSEKAKEAIRAIFEGTSDRNESE